MPQLQNSAGRAGWPVRTGAPAVASPFRFPLQMRFGDVDSYGHVNNVRFLQFLEDARVHWLREPCPGGEAESAMASLVGPENFTLVGRHEIEYLAPLLYRPEPIVVELWVTALGGSSFELGYYVTEHDGGTLYAQCSTSMVLVSRVSGRPVKLPARLREGFAAFFGPDVPFRRRPPLPSDGHRTADRPGPKGSGA